MEVGRRRTCRVGIIVERPEELILQRDSRVSLPWTQPGEMGRGEQRQDQRLLHSAMLPSALLVTGSLVTFSFLSLA